MHTTRTIRQAALAAAVVAAAAAPAWGQSASRSLAEVTPYAGYLVSGNLVDGPLGTSLSGGSGPLFGAQLAVPLGAGVAVVGNMGYSSGDLRVGLPIVGGVNVGSTKSLLFDGGLQLSVPGVSSGNRSLVPFAQVGIGGIRKELAISGLNTHATSLTYNAGLGADFSLLPGIAVRLAAKDYIGKFDFKEATGLDIGSGKTTHNWALTAGVRFGF
jgi:Outer membrane protein beta-barrel domain